AHKYSAGSDFCEGVVVKVEMGYVDHYNPLVEAEVVAIEPVYPLKGADSCYIRAYDRLQRYRYGRKRRGWGSGQATDQTYAAVLTKVAKDCGLTVDFGGKAPQQKFDFIFQNNETDIDFIKRIARELGYEVEVREKKLLVRPPLVDKAKTVSLTWGKNLKSFVPRLSTANQVTEVIVRGWDPKTKKAIIGKAKTSDVTSKMKGKGTGPDEVKKQFKGETITRIVQNPVFTIEEAETIAKAELNIRAMEYMTGDGTCLGDTSLRAGTIIEMKGLGDTFSGWYYVNESIHTFTPGSGYSTGFRVARPAWGLEPTPPATTKSTTPTGTTPTGTTPTGTTPTGTTPTGTTPTGTTPTGTTPTGTTPTGTTPTGTTPTGTTPTGTTPTGTTPTGTTPTGTTPTGTTPTGTTPTGTTPTGTTPTGTTPTGTTPTGTTPTGTTPTGTTPTGTTPTGTTPTGTT
ncbi:MAG: phage late control D family protein, partial [Polyangiaceae bacterium]